MINLRRIRKYFKIGRRKLAGYFRTEFYLKTGLFLPHPEKVYYLITNKCNFRCPMCPHWKIGLTENLNNNISTVRLREIIDEMVKLGIGELGISGGEPLLFKDKLLEILTYANSKNIYTHFVTNGSLLDENFLEKYNDCGGGHISLSVDSLNEMHNSLRGISDALLGVERAIGLVKKGNYKNIILKINFVLSNQNISDVLAVAELAVKNKFLFFVQPYNPFVYDKKNIESLENKYPLWIKKDNYQKLRQVLDRLIALKEKHTETILNSVGHIESFYNYFTSDNFRTDCFIAFDSLSITPDGRIGVCKFGEVWDLKSRSLEDYLSSTERRGIVKASRQCRSGCLQGCYYRSGFLEFLKNGPKQFWRLIK